jgi:preprotein translocase subunit SecA
MGLFPTHSEKELKRIRPLVSKVMALEEPYSKLE